MLSGIKIVKEKTAKLARFGKSTDQLVCIYLRENVTMDAFAVSGFRNQGGGEQMKKLANVNQPKIHPTKLKHKHPKTNVNKNLPISAHSLLGTHGHNHEYDMETK